MSTTAAPAVPTFMCAVGAGVSVAAIRRLTTFNVDPVSTRNRPGRPSHVVGR